MKDIYTYVAVLEYGEEIGVYFPDLPGAISGGTTEQEAFSSASEALGLHIFGLEQDGEELPKPSRLIDITTAENEKAVLVSVYMPSVRLSEVNRSVSRTVTLPAWLNAKALEKKFNFSQILQEALIQKLG